MSLSSCTHSDDGERGWVEGGSQRIDSNWKLEVGSLVTIWAATDEALTISFNQVFQGSAYGGCWPVHPFLVAFPPLPPLTPVCLCIGRRWGIYVRIVRTMRASLVVAWIATVPLTSGFQSMSILWLPSFAPPLVPPPLWVHNASEMILWQGNNFELKTHYICNMGGYR